MKVEIILSSEHFNGERNNYFHNNQILFDWDCQSLPKKGDLIGQGLLEKIFTPIILEEIENLVWSVYIIEWDFKDDVLVPVLWLEGE
jgi:hypothetical protein